jgi:hypothetical protein
MRFPHKRSAIHKSLVPQQGRMTTPDFEKINVVFLTILLKLENPEESKD